MITNKEKSPSRVSSMNCSSNNYNKDRGYINVSFLKKDKISCGPTENRTRDFCLTNNCFTIKLLAHNRKIKGINYLNFEDKI